MRKSSLFLVMTVVWVSGALAASINTTRSNIKHNAAATDPGDSAAMNSTGDETGNAATPATNPKRSDLKMNYVYWTAKNKPGSDTANGKDPNAALQSDATLQNDAAASSTIGTCRTCSGACSSCSPPKCACATASSEMTTATKCPAGCMPQKNGDCNCGDPNNAIKTLPEKNTAEEQMKANPRH